MTLLMISHHGPTSLQKQDVNIIAFQHLGISNWFRHRNLLFFIEQLAPLLAALKNA